MLGRIYIERGESGYASIEHKEKSADVYKWPDKDKFVQRSE